MLVTELWRYPVKSMQGERIERSTVGPAGLAGDRQWGVLDVGTGLTLTARREPRLLEAVARYDEATDTVTVDLPDGTTDLSAWLGRPVRLVRAGGGVRGRYEIAEDPEDEAGSPWVQWDGPETTFHDTGRTVVSVIATGSLRTWDVRRFRGNVIVEGVEGAEADLAGRTVTLGTAGATGTRPIDRCVLVTRPQPGGIARDLDVLRTVARERDGKLGVGLRVTTPGTVAVGDDLTVLD